MTSLSLSTQTVGLTPVWRRTRRNWNRLVNRYMWRFILPLSQMNGSKVQFVVLLVLIPSILAGIFVAQASQSSFAISVMMRH